MTQERLNTLRLFVPGFLILLILAGFLWLSKLLPELGLPDAADYPVVLIPMAFLGVVYRTSKLRRLAFLGPLTRVNDNIKDRLLACCEIPAGQMAARTRVREGRQLMDLFYTYIDTDATLGEKAKRVRFNGLIWSSLADLQVISVAGALVYAVGGIIRDSAGFFWLALASLLLFIIGKLLMHFVTKEHLELSNEQLDIIADYHRADLCTRINALIDNAKS